MNIAGKQYKLASAIYIGSNSIQMKIAENSGGVFRELDHVSTSVNLGQDTFSKGMISFEKVEKVCHIIKKYFTLMKDYKVQETSIVATTALRDAENKDYILDQILVKTGKIVTLLDDTEEKELIYKEMFRKMNDSNGFETSSALMTYIGTGSLGVSLCEKGTIPFTQNIRIGTLKLNEILEKMQEYTEKSNTVVEEYLSTFTSILRRLLPEKKAEYFIASGEEMDLIARLCQAEKKGQLLIIRRNSFEELYQEIKNKTGEQIEKQLHLDEEDADILMPSMAIYKTLLEFTDTEIIIDLPVNLLDCMLYSSLFPKEAAEEDARFTINTILAAKAIGGKYKYDENHALAVEKYALEIFDKTRTLHGLGKKARLILQVASLLHDIGKYVNTKRHYSHSFFLIKNSDIIGLNNDEIDVAAHVAMYHGKEVPRNWHESFSRLVPEQRTVVSKLVAIIRIADALDRSHCQKFDLLEVNLKKQKLVITGSTYKDVHLEQWTFTRKGQFFEEVYGIKAEFRQKRV
ncbi:MAG: Exopolyphosphatase [Candidatus Dichloromethanomonas elyunquensis]|nr:MAG: Exopolyphosphatase [Candidatus Dichloromethanomonas elyunquensis]